MRFWTAKSLNCLKSRSRRLFSVRSVVPAAAVLMVTAFAVRSAHAATEVETFTFGALNGYSSEDGSDFSSFDPSLGTLNSVTYNIAATADFSGGGSQDFNAAVYDLMFIAPNFTTLSEESFDAIGSGPVMSTAVCMATRSEIRTLTPSNRVWGWSCQA